MKKLYLIPYNPHILYEIGRLVDAVSNDNSNHFDVFENDVFVFFDPMDDEIEEHETNDDQIINVSDCNFDYMNNIDNLPIESMGINNMDDDNFEDDDNLEEDDVEEEDDLNVFQFFMPFDENIVDESEDEQLKILNDLIDNFNKSEEDDPNFQHKSSDLKLYWRLGDDELYSNQPIKYRKLSNIINQCILSMGRRTKNYLVRYFYYGDGGNEHM